MAQVRLKLAALVLVVLVAAGRGWAHPGWGIVVDARGNVYYTDLKQVWKIAPGGARSVVVSGVHTHELYLDAAGTLHGEHLWYDGARQKWGHYLWELTADGKLTRHPPQSGFRTDVSFVRDSAGTMYWYEGSKDRKSTRLNSSHIQKSRMPSSA